MKPTTTWTAKALAEHRGHNAGGCMTTLIELAERTEGMLRFQELQLNGVGETAYFQWETEYGDPIGKPFTALYIADAEQPLVLTPPSAPRAIQIPRNDLSLVVPTYTLKWLLDMANSHIEDIESGLADGTYLAADNSDIAYKRGVVDTAVALLRQFENRSAELCGGKSATNAVLNGELSKEKNMGPMQNEAWQEQMREGAYDDSDMNQVHAGSLADCTPNHVCDGRMVHLPSGEMCNKCGGAVPVQTLAFSAGDD